MVLKGKSKKEILICSYICHPSLANNELSGPLVIMGLSKILRPSKYTIRLLLIPETIGAISYIAKNYKNIKKNLVAGFNLTCVGDNGPYTLISSIDENTYSDKIANRIMEKRKNFKKLSFLKTFIASSNFPNSLHADPKLLSALAFFGSIATAFNINSSALTKFLLRAEIVAKRDIEL